MPESETTRPRADWAKAAEGIQLAGFAVFLLLNTTGVLPWSFWLDAISLWPVLIMSAGVKIAFEKSRAPWLLLFGPALVLGSLAWLASGNRPQAPAGPWEEALLARPEGTTSVSLEAALVGSRLRFTSATDVPTDRLVDGRSVGRSEKTRLDVRAENGVAEVRLDGGKPNVVFVPRARERWELRLPAELPLDLRIRGAGIGGDLDLTAGSKVTLRAEGVFVGVAARLPAPREETEIRMNGVFNSLTLTVPEGTPVRVHGPGLPFNAVDRGVRGAEGRPGYDVNMQGVFSAVDVITDRTISPEPPAAPAAPSVSPVPPVPPVPPLSSAPASPPPAEAPPAAPERPKAEAEPEPPAVS
jgi:hypothetical protein